MTFRSVGEGTGRSKDIDLYDHYYRHLVLWDDEKLKLLVRTGLEKFGGGRINQ